MRFVALLCALLASACIQSTSFVCEANADCDGEAGGICEANGFCSFADSSCTSGQRYGSSSGSSSGACVAGDPDPDPDPTGFIYESIPVGETPSVRIESLARNGEVLLYYVDYEWPAAELRAFDIATERSYSIAANISHVQISADEGRVLAFSNGSALHIGTLYYVDLTTEVVTEIAQDVDRNRFRITEDWSQASWADANYDLHSWIPSAAASTHVGSIETGSVAQQPTSGVRMAWREGGVTTDRIAAWDAEGVIEKTVPAALRDNVGGKGLKLSADGKTLTYVTGAELHVWNLESGLDQSVGADMDDIFADVLGVSPDGSHVFYRPEDLAVWVFDVAAGTSTALTAPPVGIDFADLMFADDFSTLLFTHDKVDDHSTLSIWTKATGAIEEIATSVHSAELAPSGEGAVYMTSFDDVSSTGTLNVWNAASGARTVLAGVAPVAGYDTNPDYSQLMFFTDAQGEGDNGTGSLHSVSIAAGDSTLVDSDVHYTNAYRERMLRFAKDGTGFLYAKNHQPEAVTADYYFYDFGGTGVGGAVATAAYPPNIFETLDGSRWRFAGNYRRNEAASDMHFWERATGTVIDVANDVYLRSHLLVGQTTDQNEVVYAHNTREIRVWSGDTGTTTTLTPSAGSLRVDLPSRTVGVILDPDLDCSEIRCEGTFFIDQLGMNETPAVFGTDIIATFPLAGGVWAFWSSAADTPSELFLAVPIASAAAP